MAGFENEKPPVLADDGATATPHSAQEKLEAGSVAPLPATEENFVTRDGVRLHPQPTADPLDPLNWSSFQKHSILAIVMFKYADHLYAELLG